MLLLLGVEVGVINRHVDQGRHCVIVFALTSTFFDGGVVAVYEGTGGRMTKNVKC